MSANKPLTQGEVLELVYTWFRSITSKIKLDELLPLLSNTKLEMVFPEKTLHNYTDFAGWYEDVTHLFFDQVHDIKLLTVDLKEQQANVTLIVNWQSRTWQAPAATSQWQSSNVHQSWIVERDESSGRPVISTYKVGSFDQLA